MNILKSTSPAPRSRKIDDLLARGLLLAAVAGLLTACGSTPKQPASVATATSGGSATQAGKSAAMPAPTGQVKPPHTGGGYYKDDGPSLDTPDDERLAAIPDAQPRVEPLHRFANRPYVVFNRRYQPMTHIQPYRAQGIGSWYGRKFHGQRTASGEVYDMFGMTAAHPTLPIPSYVRVTNPANERSVIVRVNDRGPFHAGRLIDLSYVAAWKLGYIGSGSAQLEVESILPADIPLLAQRTQNAASPAADMVQRTAMDDTLPRAQTSSLLPTTTESRGIFLQLGAFSNADNAEALKAHLSRELDDAELGDKLSIQARAGIYRLQLGPWPDRAAAQRIAEQLQASFDITPMVVQR